MAETLDQMITTWMDDHGSDDWQDDIELDALNQILDVYVQSPELQEMFYFNDFRGWANDEELGPFIKVGDTRVVPRYLRTSLDGAKSIEEAMMRAQVCNDTKVITALEQLQKIIDRVSKAKT